jgi:hypothetical protein
MQADKHQDEFLTRVHLRADQIMIDTPVDFEAEDLAEAILWDVPLPKDRTYEEVNEYIRKYIL